jgi:hypothetical protein
MLPSKMRKISDHIIKKTAIFLDNMIRYAMLLINCKMSRRRELKHREELTELGQDNIVCFMVVEDHTKEWVCRA